MESPDNQSTSKCSNGTIPLLRVAERTSCWKRLRRSIVLGTIQRRCSFQCRARQGSSFQSSAFLYSGSCISYRHALDHTTFYAMCLRHGFVEIHTSLSTSDDCQEPPAPTSFSAQRSSTSRQQSTIPWTEILTRPRLFASCVSIRKIMERLLQIRRHR
jgi:hypothetical protein